MPIFNPSGVVVGTAGGTANRLARFTAATLVGNSLLSDDATNVTLTSGQFLLPDGSATAPVLRFSDGNTNYGWFEGNPTGNTIWSYSVAGVATYEFSSTNIGIASLESLSWNSTNNLATGQRDLNLFRDAAGILAQRDGTNAQALRIYNTFTDAANNEFVVLRFSGNLAQLFTAANGTGTARQFDLGTNAIVRWTIGATNGNLFPSSTNTYNLGATSNRLLQAFVGTSGIDSTGSVLVTAATVGIGYGTGAGGTVTQLTSKSTGVTLNTATGQITMNNAALAGDTTVSFTLTNSAIAATDILLWNHLSAGTAGSYLINSQSAAGSASVNVRNITTGSLSEAIVIGYAVVKGVTS